ncbi:uncharacterized protein LOC119193730 [Manduca sexta]|uniref:uncharacterized protein LOC119193730 n=1 Tax=Manduca sexta TaxID=7130 RepID=UPI00188DDD84|nr:uncharacterized protein LOC119193730 [Manduca sexta]
MDIEEPRVISKEDLLHCGHMVRHIVRKSGNLKGTSQKALNHVTDTIKQYVEQPESELMARLEKEAREWKERGAQLAESVKKLQEENSSLRRRLEELEASASKPSTEEVLAMIEARVQARMESIQMGPAQRPPLAHERRTTGDTQLPVADGIVGERKRPAASHSGSLLGDGGCDAHDGNNRQKNREKNGAPEKRKAPGPKTRKGGKKGQAVQPAPEPRPLPPAPASMDTPWVVVAKKSKKGKPATAQAANAQPPQPTRRAEPKLRPPRSAAVIISLTPSAVAKGLSYKQVLTDAQTVELRLTELDYTATPESVAAALSKAGECSSELIKVGQIRPDRSGWRGGGRQVQANDVDEVQESAAERPMEVAAEFTRPFDSFGIDSESSESMSSVRSKKFWRRHSPKESEICLTSETDEPAPKAVTTDGRGRGRPPSTGHYAGLKRPKRARRSKAGAIPSKNGERTRGSTSTRKRPVTSKRMDIEEPRVISKEDLLHCGHMPESELMARLEKEAREWKERGAQLAESVKKLQEENSSLRRRLEELEASASKPSTEEVLAMIEARVQARMESIQMGPAQRPPLAHERRTTGDTQLPVADGIVGERKRPAASHSGSLLGDGGCDAHDGTNSQKNREKNGAPEKRKAPGPKTRKGGKKGQAVQPAPEPRPLPPAPASMDTPWVVVAKKSKKGKPATAQSG